MTSDHLTKSFLMGILNRNEIELQTELQIIDLLAQELVHKLPTSNFRTKIVVIIPAKNEALEIEKSLLALINQKTKEHQTFPKSSYEVIVLCHNCTDDTYQKCHDLKETQGASNFHILELNSEVATNVGAARRILMNIACERLACKESLIVSTDADTLAHNLWLHNLECYLEKEVHLICGLINSDYSTINGQALNYLLAKDKYLMLQAQLESILMENPNNPWPRHNYSWGPNLAIKKHVYQNIGGMNPLSFLEDVDLFNRVVENGYVVKHCMNSIVTTSVRTNSRCDEGFGAELKVWSENEGIPYEVEGLVKLKSRYHIYTLIKNYYQNPSIDILKELSRQTHLKKKTITILFSRFERYEAMMIYMKQALNFCPVWNTLHPNISVFNANQELETYLSS